MTDFIKKHMKMIVVGTVLFVITLGGYGLYKLFTKES